MWYGSTFCARVRYPPGRIAPRGTAATNATQDREFEVIRMPRQYPMAGRLCVLFSLLSMTVAAGDWPQWRYDAGRTAASPEELPGELHLQWMREYPRLEPAWEDTVNRDRMPYDRVYEPVVMGSTLFVGSSRNDSLTALDTRTGAEQWRFYADGPVRLPPAAGQGKVYFVSDDGYLYCVNAVNGSLAWRRRGGPSDRKVLGNRRLVSAWPARGGPVLADGVVYFAASIWPFEGVFIHAVDAETGESIWTNDGVGSAFMRQPHDAAAFAGIAPQGALAALGDRLLVPGGRTVPGCFDRDTGKLRYFFLSGSKIKGGRSSALRKHEGGSHVCGIGNYYFNHRGVNTAMYELSSGEMYALWPGTIYPVLTADTCYLSGDSVAAYDFASLEKQGNQWKMAKRWECPVDASAGLIKAGSRLYAGGSNLVSAIHAAPQGPDGPPEVTWQAKVEGTAARLLAADERLFVVTIEGSIYAFGGDAPASPTRHAYAVEQVSHPSGMTDVASSMLAGLPLTNGWCLAFGLDTGELVRELAQQPDLRIVAVESDRQKVARLRRAFDDEGLYGTRISVHAGNPSTFDAPPYMAVLTVFENLGSVANAAFLKDVFRSMRPYGGTAYLPTGTDPMHAIVSQAVASLGLAGAKVSRQGRYTVLRRDGPLAGAGTWTQHNGDVANRSKSDDKLVRLPLGLLWFGGSTHEDVLPRHGHGPSELVIGGRLFIQGLNMLSARDVYTGQVLWKRTFDDLGTYEVYYDKSYVPDPLDLTYNQKHIPGANARGGNYVATADRVYLAAGSDCFVMDPATGKTLDTFSLPTDDSDKRPAWGYIGVYEDVLIAGAGKATFSRLTGGKPSLWDNYDTSSSEKLVVMDRRTGEVIWSLGSKLAFRHNAIAAGGGKVFCIDAMPQPVFAKLRPRGLVPEGKPTLLALDAKTGEQVWVDTNAVFGTWLGYSRKNDILVQAGRPSRDMLKGEPGNRINTFRGRTGDMLWDKRISYGGHCMLHGDTIYFHAQKSAGSAVDMLTGNAKLRKHPLTGTEVPWRYQRYYGCNSGVCSEYLLAFRSGAAGFYDLATDGGTGNIGGFKSGCSANLIAADGVLNAPDYTRSCTCTYQNQTSLALIHNPDAELWTFNDFKWDGKPVRQAGINLAAPGDRRTESGTLWLDYPSSGGPSPDLPVAVDGAKLLYFRHHASGFAPNALRWVGASGVSGVERLTVTLSNGSAHRSARARGEYGIASSRDDAEQGTGNKGKLGVSSTDLELVRDKGPQLIGMRFSDVDIAPGAEPGPVYIQFTVDEATSDSTALTFFGQASAAPKAFGPGPARISVRKRTHASVTWQPPAWNRVEDAGPAQRTPDLGPIVREIVSLPGWKRGNAIVIIVEGTGKRVAKAFDGDPRGAPVLRVAKSGEDAPAEPVAATGSERPYTVRLVFCEPDVKEAGQRVFDVALQGRKVLTDFDVAREAGGARRTVVKAFTGILADKELALTFTRKTGDPLLCGIEIVAE